jgi:uncharacterized protein YjbJ (UPF0337 family)
MNTSEGTENWEEEEAKFKQAFENMTDDDLMLTDGKKDDLLGKLLIRLGKTKD